MIYPFRGLCHGGSHSFKVQLKIVYPLKKPLNLAYLRQRLSEILRGKKNNRNPESVESREDFVLDGIAAHIEEIYMKDLTLDKLAGIACMNRFKFCRAFKERFGQTFISYLNNIRVKNAAELLKNLNLSITEIAYFVGDCTHNIVN